MRPEGKARNDTDALTKIWKSNGRLNHHRAGPVRAISKDHAWREHRLFQILREDVGLFAARWPPTHHDGLLYTPWFPYALLRWVQYGIYEPNAGRLFWWVCDAEWYLYMFCYRSQHPLPNKQFAQLHPGKHSAWPGALTPVSTTSMVYQCLARRSFPTTPPPPMSFFFAFDFSQAQ